MAESYFQPEVSAGDRLRCTARPLPGSHPIAAASSPGTPGLPHGPESGAHKHLPRGLAAEKVQILRGLWLRALRERGRIDDRRVRVVGEYVDQPDVLLCLRVGLVDDSQRRLPPSYVS